MKRKAMLSMILICVLLFGTISIVQAYRPGCGLGNKPGRGIGRGPMQTNIDECIEELDLSPDQISEFIKIREAHGENMDRIREEMGTYRSQMRQAMQKGTDLGEDILNQGAELWKERERERLKFRQQLSNLLTQEQRDRLYMCKNFRSRPRDNTPKSNFVPPEG